MRGPGPIHYLFATGERDDTDGEPLCVGQSAEPFELRGNLVPGTLDLW